MSHDLEFDGERYVPGTAGEIAHEHWHRYAFARRFTRGRRVADVACGEGYGSALLADGAAHVTGIDIDARTLAHARAAYAGRSNVAFVEGSAAAIPLADSSVDAIVSLETIEHIDAADQRRMLAEFARILSREGVLVLSSPNRPQYSDARGYANPFHVHELDRDELAQLLAPHFPAQRWYRQRRYLGSALWAEQASERYEALSGSESSVATAVLPEAMYFVVVAARAPGHLPDAAPSLSLFTDSDDAELARIDGEAREVMRLDALLRTRDEEFREQARLASELRQIVAQRDQALEARARAQARQHDELVTKQADIERLLRELSSQERIVAYQHSFRWWLTLPALRVRRLWHRLRAA